MARDLALQRRARGDGRQWRTVVRFARADAPIVQRGAELLAGVFKVLADPARLRSPMVSRCIEDCLSGQRYPLDLIRAVPAG